MSKKIYCPDYKGQPKVWFVIKMGKIVSKHYNFYNAQCGVEKALKIEVKRERELSKYDPWFKPCPHNFTIKHISELQEV